MDSPACFHASQAVCPRKTGGNSRDLPATGIVKPHNKWLIGVRTAPQPSRRITRSAAVVMISRFGFSGLRIGERTGFDLQDLYENGVSLNRYPILEILIHKGVKGLYEWASQTGFFPESEGYVSPCHLCLHIRTHLYFNDKRYLELYPHFFHVDLKEMVWSRPFD